MFQGSYSSDFTSLFFCIWIHHYYHFFLFLPVKYALVLILSAVFVRFMQYIPCPPKLAGLPG